MICCRHKAAPPQPFDPKVSEKDKRKQRTEHIGKHGGYITANCLRHTILQNKNVYLYKQGSKSVIQQTVLSAAKGGSSSFSLWYHASGKNARGFSAYIAFASVFSEVSASPEYQPMTPSFFT